MEKNQKHLIVILKTVERCNLNCKYCYFFNGGDESFKRHPAFISDKVIHQLVSCIIASNKDLGINNVSIIFHGGEPTLQPVDKFDAMCSFFTKELSPFVQLNMSIQTNATLISEKWIAAFSKHNISVGVSLDGPKEYNDVERVDHHNVGSYDLVKKGIDLLNEAVKCGKISDIGALCVINPENDGRVIYRHFIDELHFSRIDFLLPDATHDDTPNQSAEKYGRYLCAILDEWTKDNNNGIVVRYLQSILRIMGGMRTTLISIGPELNDVYPITVSSNGEISPDDTLRIANSGKLMQLSDIWSISFKDFFELPTLKKLRESKSNLPKECIECCWKKVCYGGSYIHRYSKENGFENPSVFCEGLKMIYAKSAAFLLKSGLPFSSLQEVLLCN